MSEKTAFSSGSWRVALVSLVLLLAGGIFFVSLVGAETGPLPAWRPATAAVPPTATAPTGWWQDLPTPAAVIPTAQADPTEQP